jgi:nucleoprotein TPR
VLTTCQAPILSQQREEYSRLQSEASQLASQLAQTISDRDRQGNLAQENLQKLNRTNRENELLQRQLHDLGRQVQLLLKKVARLENPALPPDEFFETRSVKPAENVEEVITDNLVLFASIEELQEQNQKLLKVVRELGAKMEAEEREYREEMEKEQGEAVREAHEAIQELVADLDRQKKTHETTVQAYIKEREALKGMLARAERGVAMQMPVDGEDGDAEPRGGTSLAHETDLAKELAETQKQFAVYKSEIGIDSGRLREDLMDSQREAGKLGVALAKANAKIEFLNGMRLLSKTFLANSLLQRPPTSISRATHITGTRQ